MIVERDLFGECPVNNPAIDRKRKNTQPRGYGGIPGTRPSGETCGSCRFHVINRMAKNYHKCELARARWTGGAGSDIRVRAAACSRWERPA